MTANVAYWPHSGTNSLLLSTFMEFEWDVRKDSENLAKHGISFSEAMTVFGDPLELTANDPDHSETEFRFLSVGISKTGKILVVSYTERKGQRTRIISARKATRLERRQYESKAAP